MNIFKVYENDNGLGIWTTTLFGEPETIRKFKQYKSITINDQKEITTGKSVQGGHLGVEVSYDSLSNELKELINSHIQEVIKTEPVNSIK